MPPLRGCEKLWDNLECGDKSPHSKLSHYFSAGIERVLAYLVSLFLLLNLQCYKKRQMHTMQSKRGNRTMLYFQDRFDAGKRLAQLLSQYKNNSEVVIYALPRGGVEVAAEIAKFLNAPLDLVFAHKIGHPYQPEYAIAALSESGQLVGSANELENVDEVWLETEKANQIEEMKRRRQVYLRNRNEISPEGKIAIIVDDGIATGLTLKAGIMDLKNRHPKKMVVAVPVAPKSTAELIRKMVDEFVAIEVPDDYAFLGSVGSYYHQFNQVEDSEVIHLLSQHP